MQTEPISKITNEKKDKALNKNDDTPSKIILPNCVFQSNSGFKITPIMHDPITYPSKVIGYKLSGELFLWNRN